MPAYPVARTSTILLVGAVVAARGAQGLPALHVTHGSALTFATR